MYLTGLGDLAGLIDKIQDVIPADKQPEFLSKLSEGTFTLRLLYEQFQTLLKMGSLGQVNYLL
jgi:signal recognition particle subunit SRP54